MEIPTKLATNMTIKQAECAGLQPKPLKPKRLPVRQTKREPQHLLPEGYLKVTSLRSQTRILKTDIRVALQPIVSKQKNRMRSRSLGQ